MSLNDLTWTVGGSLNIQKKPMQTLNKEKEPKIFKVKYFLIECECSIFKKPLRSIDC